MFLTAQSLRIAPASSLATSTTNTAPSKFTPNAGNNLTHPSAPSAPGLPDTLRASLQSTTSSTIPGAPKALTSTHPLESRLTQWTATQQALQHTLLRRTHGLADPLRRGMELQMVRQSDSFRPSVLGAPSGVHDDILSGRDMELSWEDVYAGQDGLRAVENSGGDGQGVDSSWTGEMERMVGMGKW